MCSRPERLCCRRRPFHLAHGEAVLALALCNSTRQSRVTHTIAFNVHACEQVDEGVVTLVNGWVVASANVPFIDLGSIPSRPSNIPPPALPLSAPLDIFRSGVLLFCCCQSLL